jgi:NitT/TauT family transport system permease protein
MKKILLYVEGFLAINFIWYIAYSIVKSKIISNPIDVYRIFILFFNEKMHIHIIISLGRIIAGISISLILGGIIAYMIANYSLNKHLNSLVLFTYPIPKMLLLPIIIIIGLCDTSKIILITLILFLQITLSVRNSVKAINNECMDYISSLGATKKQVFYHVVFPKIIPGIITCIRAALGTALAILFICEGYGTSSGIGYYVINAWSRMDYLSMYKGIMIMSIIGALLYLCLDLIEIKVVKWK